MQAKKITPVHPGEILFHDFVEPLGLNQSALARAIGVTPMRVSQLVRGQRAITADSALRLAQYFGTRAAWWLDLQTHYDLEVVSDQLQSGIAREISPCTLKSVTSLAM